MKIIRGKRYSTDYYGNPYIIKQLSEIKKIDFHNLIDNTYLESSISDHGRSQSRVVAKYGNDSLTLYDRSLDLNVSSNRPKEFEEVQNEIIKQYILANISEDVKNNCCEVFSFNPSLANSLEKITPKIIEFGKKENAGKNIVLNFEDDDSLAILNITSNGEFSFVNAETLMKSKVELVSKLLETGKQSTNILKLKNSEFIPPNYTGCVEHVDGSKQWLVEGKRHRLDGPAVEYASGEKHWYKEDLHHREDGPAIEYTDGTKKWYKEGEYHRLDGPAIEWIDGTKYWYIEGVKYSEAEWKKKVEELKILKLNDGEYIPQNYTGCIEFPNRTRRWYKERKTHRLDGPAVEFYDGEKGWYKDDLLHRLDGPAIECPNGNKFWFIEGKEYSEENWKKKVEELKILKLNDEDDVPVNYTGCVEYSNQTKKWYKEGKYHRLDGPAIEYADGAKSWYIEGKRHRLDGPAVEYASGEKHWYIEGKCYLEADWKKKMEELSNILPPSQATSTPIKGYDDDVFSTPNGEVWKVNNETSFPVVRVKSWEAFKKSEEGKRFVGLVLQKGDGPKHPPIRIQANCGVAEKLVKEWINIPTVSICFGNNNNKVQSFYSKTEVADNGSAVNLEERISYEPLLNTNGSIDFSAQDPDEEVRVWTISKGSFVKEPNFSLDVSDLRNKKKLKKFKYSQDLSGKTPWLVFEIENHRVSSYSFNPTVISSSEVETSKKQFEETLKQAFPQQEEKAVTQELKENMPEEKNETRVIGGKTFPVKYTQSSWENEVRKTKFTGVVVTKTGKEYTVVDGEIASLPNVLNYPVEQGAGLTKEFTTGKTGGSRFNMFGPSFIKADGSKHFYLEKDYANSKNRIPPESFFKVRNELYGDEAIALDGNASTTIAAFLLKLFPECYLDITGLYAQDSDKVVCRLKFNPETSKVEAIAADAQQKIGSNLPESIQKEFDYLDKLDSVSLKKLISQTKELTWGYVTPEKVLFRLLSQTFPTEIEGIRRLESFIQKQIIWNVGPNHSEELKKIFVFLNEKTKSNNDRNLTLEDIVFAIQLINDVKKKMEEPKVLKLKESDSVPQNYTGCVEYPDGNKYWFKEGKRHRENGPAIEFADGTKKWLKEGKLHRLDGPAVEFVDGEKHWFIEGKHHRLDGPAIEHASGNKSWYIEDKFYSEADWKKKVEEIRSQNSVDKKVETKDSPNTQQTTKQEEKKNMAEELSTKDLVKKTLASDAKKAAVRVTCKKLSKAARSMIAEMIADRMKYKGKQKTSFVSSFSEFLMTPFGASMIDGLIGSGIPLVKDRLPEKFQGPAMIVAEELRVNAIATAGEEVLDTITPMLGMMTNILTDSFSSMVLSEDEDETPAERVRVENGSSTVAHQELEATQSASSKLRG
jgi:hypothetical protein